MRAITITALMMLLAATLAHAKVQTKEIDYKHGDVQLRGYLAWDDAAGDQKRPGVLVVHEWWGLNNYVKGRARQLAEQGYVAFAADMYGAGVVTSDPKEAGQLAGAIRGDRAKLRDRALAGLQVLQNQPTVDAGKVAAIGYCFGGTTVLELARGGANIAGVVSFHGGLDTPNPEQTQNVKAKVLVLHGADDPMVPPEQVQNFYNEMKAAGADVQIVAYSGAVHAFTNPDADKLGMAPVKYNASADKRSWIAMKAFFDEIFK